MLKKIFAVSFASMAAFLPFSSYSMAGANGEFIVGLGPIELGKVVLVSNCDQQVCNYEARIKGSFMFIGADIKENGIYKQIDSQVIPVSTQYAEKIGSKRKAYNYDFLERKIENKKDSSKSDLPEDVYPLLPLISQVILDLHMGGPREQYDFLSKHKIKSAVIVGYGKKLTEEGTIHHFIGKDTKKDKELEFFFLENAGVIDLQKVAYGSFHMSRKQ